MSHKLYRHFGPNDALLYVGISLRVMQRTIEHKSDSIWFNEIVRITMEDFDSKEAALEAERLAIINEKPKHNKQQNHGAMADNINAHMSVTSIRERLAARRGVQPPDEDDEANSITEVLKVLIDKIAGLEKEVIELKLLIHKRELLDLKGRLK